MNNMELQTPPTPQNLDPIPPTETSWLSGKVIAIVIAVLLVLGVGGYLAFTHNGTSKNISNETVQTKSEKDQLAEKIARETAANAAIKADINFVKNQSENIYINDDNSYDNLCTNKDVINMLNIGLSASGDTGSVSTRCNDSPKAWAANLLLKVPEGGDLYWCADSMNTGMGRTAELKGATSCSGNSSNNSTSDQAAKNEEANDVVLENMYLIGIKAEIAWQDNGSYENVCETPDIVKAINVALSAGGDKGTIKTRCNDSRDAWAANAILKWPENLYLCVDNTMRRDNKMLTKTKIELKGATICP